MSQNRRQFLKTVGAGTLGVAAMSAWAQQPARRKPNVVVVLTDDQGWGDLGFTGNTNLATPNIDRLAGEGAVLQHFFVQPLCAPTRAELLTGRYYPRTGVHGVSKRQEYMNLDEVTIGDVFKQSGYATGCFGKWHNGSPYPYHPNGRGFDEFYGFCCGHWGHYFDGTVEHNGENVTFDGYINDAFTEKAMGFIKENREEPFLCYVAYNTPHSPFQVPDNWYEKFAEMDPALRHRDPEKEELDKTRCVLAMCENLDWNVGRLAACIEELDLTRDTIFVYFSDNGPNTWRWNGGMFGKKGFADEGGVRSPCIIRWPGVIPEGNQVTEIAGCIDLLPTLAGLAGVPVNVPKMDGVNLEPLLKGDEVDWPDRALYAHTPNNRFTSIRTQQYRAGGNSKGLFDMEADPGQEHDLSKELPEIYKQLQDKIEAWKKEVLVKTPPERVLAVGYPAFPLTVLNAQDGIASGDIHWSSVHPNASFFQDWHNLEDSVYWDIEVKTAGEYEVDVLYTSPAEDVGAVLEASFKDAAISATIETPFDPPLKNKHDLVERRESYEKDFRPLKLGTLNLKPGRGNLQLRALKKPGNNVADIRAVRVRLLQ